MSTTENPTSRVRNKPFCRIFRVTSHFCKIRPTSLARTFPHLFVGDTTDDVTTVVSHRVDPKHPLLCPVFILCHVLIFLSVLPLFVRPDRLAAAYQTYLDSCRYLNT
jgi:hypothetical protein